MQGQEISARKVADGLLFGEGIRWRDDHIVLSDMIGRRVVAVDPGVGDVRTLLAVPEQPNGLVVMDDGSVLILSMFDRKVLRLTGDGEVRPYADLAALTTGYLGDVVRHPNGDLYVDDVGARVLHGEKPAPIGRVIQVKPDGEARVVLENLAFPNGIVISADGRTLTLAESFTYTISTFDIAGDGSLSGRRRLIGFESLIDGLGVDDEGGVWPCLPRERRIVRVDTAGQITHVIAMPGYEPIACSIGGPDGRTMCITAIADTGGNDLFEEMVTKRVRASVWVADVPYPKVSARP